MAKKRAPLRICALCLESRLLQRSHLIPAAMYKYIIGPHIKNDHSVVIDRKITGTTSKQVQEFLLCAACERLINDGGEKGSIYMPSHVGGPRLIFLRDCESNTEQAFAQLIATSRPAKNMT